MLMLLVHKRDIEEAKEYIDLCACKCLEGCSKRDIFQKKQASTCPHPGSNSCGHISSLSSVMLTFPYSEASQDSETN